MGKKLEGQLEFDFMKDANLRGFSTKEKVVKYTVWTAGAYTLGFLAYVIFSQNQQIFEPIKNYIGNIL